jgi:Uma2 family endonuclease
MDIDLALDPPPDLAIEIDMTRVSLPRLPIYQALAVPEVWRFDGERLVFLRWVDGEYEEIEQSVSLPLATATELMLLLHQVQEMGETTWARSVRRWIREKLDH